MKSLIFLCVLSIALQSCIWGSKRDLVGGYYLSATDSRDQMEIQHTDKTGYAFSIVNATVFAIGYDNRFIIAKQHPRSHNGKINKGITNYFIIPVQQKMVSEGARTAFGPLTLAEFNQKREELNITNIDFKIVFSDLE